MYLENTSFDAIITDKNGLTLEVDCRVTEPTASGLPAEISIEVPLTSEKRGVLENPCSLRGSDGGLEIKIDELWYRSIPTGITRRKHARGTFKINHAGRLWVKRGHWKSERGLVKFLLSPVRFFEEHSKSEMVDYSSTPRMTAELFKLRIAEFGEIRFMKSWAVHRVDSRGIAAEIRNSFIAEIQYDGTTPIDKLVHKIKGVLTPLSILTRQAITLHGWIWEKQDGIETMWFDPLDPNLAPDMAEPPPMDLCFPGEFEAHAESIVEKFLRASSDTQQAITQLSVALAPHVEQSTAQAFSALFGALEEVVALEKLTIEERKRLRESDASLIEALLDKKKQVESTGNAGAAAVAARLGGYAKSVKNSGPSFNVRFEKFKSVYPALSVYMSDLWPLQGSDTLPGLKQIRDSLAHGVRHEFNSQAIAVAHWHFSRFAERLAFLVLGADVPCGIRPNSSLFGREPWYDGEVWRDVQVAARRSP